VQRDNEGGKYRNQGGSPKDSQPLLFDVVFCDRGTMGVLDRVHKCGRRGRKGANWSKPNVHLEPTTKDGRQKQKREAATPENTEGTGEKRTSFKRGLGIGPVFGSAVKTSYVYFWKKEIRKSGAGGNWGQNRVRGPKGNRRRAGGQLIFQGKKPEVFRCASVGREKAATDSQKKRGGRGPIKNERNREKKRGGVRKLPIVYPLMPKELN